MKLRQVFLATQFLGSLAVPGVPDSVGYLSSAYVINTPLDNRSAVSQATRYSFMLEGCCNWDDYNLSAPVLLHTEINPYDEGFEADFTYDKLYNFFDGEADGQISWWWAQVVHGKKLCLKAVETKLYLATCDATDLGQNFGYKHDGEGHIVHLSSGKCVEQPAGAAFHCSGKASSGCEFLEGPLNLADCDSDDPGQSQLWLAPRRPAGLGDILEKIANGTVV